MNETVIKGGDLQNQVAKHSMKQGIKGCWLEECEMVAVVKLEHN